MSFIDKSDSRVDLLIGSTTPLQTSYAFRRIDYIYHTLIASYDDSTNSSIPVEELEIWISNSAQLNRAVLFKRIELPGIIELPSITPYVFVKRGNSTRPLSVSVYSGKSRASS
jgi:hypothetical protein